MIQVLCCWILANSECVLLSTDSLGMLLVLTDSGVVFGYMHFLIQEVCC